MGIVEVYGKTNIYTFNVCPFLALLLHCSLFLAIEWFFLVCFINIFFIPFNLFILLRYPISSESYSRKVTDFRPYFVFLLVFFAANMAMVALISADSGIMPDEYRHWAMCIIHYALGDTGFSYLIGFGDQGWAHSPHHRSR